jgi:hypothetical protein
MHGVPRTQRLAEIVCQGFGCGCLTRPWEPARPGFTYAPLLDVDTSLRGF